MMSRWTAMNGTKNKKCCYYNHQFFHFSHPLILFLIHLLLIFGEGIQGIQHKEFLPGSTTFNDPSKTVVLPVLALLDLSSADGKSSADGVSLLKTAQTAVSEVNARQLIPGHHLQLLVNDSKCDSGAGVDAFFHAIYTTKEPIDPTSGKNKSRSFVALLGPHCSDVTERVAGVTSYWNIVQISHAATSAGLSDRQKFPNFFRTAVAESTHNAARLALLRNFKWDRVSILVQNEDDYSLVVNDLSALLEDANTTVSNFLTFAPDELTDQLETLKDRDARIIIGSFSPSLAVPIFCEVKEKDLYGPDHVWIWPGSVFSSERWLDQLQQQTIEWSNSSSCKRRLTKKDLMAVIEGHFFLKPHPHPVNISDSQFRSYEIQNMAGDGFHGEIYDAVWTLALALGELQNELLLQQPNQRMSGNTSNGTFVGRGVPDGRLSRYGSSSLSEFTYSRKDIAERLMTKISGLRFQGASGLVSFSGADRIGTTALFQIQNGIAKQIGLFHPDMGLELNVSCPVRWPSGQPPVATRIIKYRIDTVAPAAFFTMTLLACLGIFFAFICLSFNLAKRKLKCIKLSSPKLNNIAIVGSVLIYGAVILMGVDHATLIHDSAFPYICTGRVYFLSAGFSLAFGAMFTKTFRVHRIFSMRNSLIKNRLLADKQLIGLILSLLLMDTLLIGLWVALDPLERHLYNLAMVVDSLDPRVVYQPQAEVCRSHRSTMWAGILYFKKGLLLIGGVYMAWETRKVAIPALNDSPYIGMNVYNVVLTSIIVVFCGSLLSDRTTVYYIVVATLILTSTTTALCLLFLPKFHAVWKQAHGGAAIDPISQGTGLKLEFNTRRMVVDDRKELLTRAEIMNRVYHRDIAKLDAEIEQLERILARPDINSSISTLDDYSSAIQAEVIQLYAKLDSDQPGSEQVSSRGSSTWHLPRCFNRLISRSCTSLQEPPRAPNHHLLTATAVINCHSKRPASSTTNLGWGSVSCIDHKANCSVEQNPPQQHLHHSMITLVNLSVDDDVTNLEDTNNMLYQLVDKSLLGDSELHQRLLIIGSIHGPKEADCSKPDDALFQNEIVLSLE